MLNNDTFQLLTVALTVLTPVYVYLYKINQHIGVVDNIVKNCPYCNRKVEMANIEENT